MAVDPQHYTTIDYILLALAIWRVSHMISIEHGPGDVFDRFRVWTGAFLVPGVGWQAETFWGKLVICPLCLSVWFAALIVIAVLISPLIWPVVVVLALSGLASFLTLLVHRV